MHSPNTLSPIRATRWHPWLLAALLLVVQALLAAHAVGHLDDDGDIQCDVCLVGHGMGHTLPTSPLVLAAPKPQRRECIKQKDAATSAAPPTPCQRGPPEQLRFA